MNTISQTKYAANWAILSFGCLPRLPRPPPAAPRVAGPPVPPPRPRPLPLACAGRVATARCFSTNGMNSLQQKRQPVFSSAPSLNFVWSALYWTVTNCAWHSVHCLLSFTVTFDALLNKFMMTSHELQHNFHFFGADVQSRTSTPRSHSSQTDTPSWFSEFGHVGCGHELQPALFGMPLNGVLL